MSRLKIHTVELAGTDEVAERDGAEAGLQEGCRGKAALAAQARGKDWDGVGESNQGHQEHHHGQVLDMEETSRTYDRKYTVFPCLLFLQLNELYP